MRKHFFKLATAPQERKGRCYPYLSDEEIEAQAE